MVAITFFFSKKATVKYEVKHSGIYGCKIPMELARLGMLVQLRVNGSRIACFTLGGANVPMEPRMFQMYK